MNAILIDASETCSTCEGAGCKKCNQSGIVKARIPALRLKVWNIDDCAKQIDIRSVGDDGYHRIEIQLSRDDCDSGYSDAYAKWMVNTINAAIEKGD